jgi:uncharacterized iron-regulated protein
MSLVCVGVLSACAASGTPRDTTPPTAAAALVDARSGEHLAMTELARRMGDVRMVFVPERHGDPAFHRAQLTVLKLLSDHHPGHISVGIEWLPRTAQPALDAWLGGSEGRDVLSNNVDWVNTWGHNFAAYAPIFEWAQAHAAPVFALNAPGGLARAVARRGREGLTQEESAEVTPLDSGTPAHRARFDALMNATGAAHGGHTMSSERLARLYTAQLVWDEAMRDEVVRFLDAPAYSDQILVVFAGTGHIDFSHGIPERVRALRDAPFLIVRPVAHSEASAFIANAKDAPYPERRADVLWLLPEATTSDSAE